MKNEEKKGRRSGREVRLWDRKYKRKIKFNLDFVGKFLQGIKESKFDLKRILSKIKSKSNFLI